MDDTVVKRHLQHQLGKTQSFCCSTSVCRERFVKQIRIRQKELRQGCRRGRGRESKSARARECVCEREREIKGRNMREKDSVKQQEKEYMLEQRKRGSERDNERDLLEEK